MNLAEIVKLLGQINMMLPLVMAIEKAVVSLFKDATPNLSNTERIAVLRMAGLTLEAKGEVWFVKHGLLDVPPVVPEAD